MRTEVNYHPHNSVYVRTEAGSVIHLYTKFEADGLFRLKVMRGPTIWKLGHLSPATPSWGSLYGPTHPCAAVRCRHHRSTSSCRRWICV